MTIGDAIAAGPGALATQVRDVDFWRALCPWLAVSPQAELRKMHVETGTATLCTHELSKNGYFSAESIFSLNACNALKNGAIALADASIPASFLFVYDEAWSMLFTVRALLERMLAQRMSVVPDFWVYRVGKGGAASGWRAHRDGSLAEATLDASGLPQLLNCWIALTDVDERDSCMHVLPTSVDPYLAAGSTCTGLTDSIRSLAHALPVRQGSVLGWNQRALHWGSAPTRDNSLRISIAAYFQSDTLVNPRRSVDHAAPLLLEDRLSHIFNMLWRYQHYEQCAQPWMKIAKAYAAASKLTAGSSDIERALSE
jgi:Phytanoyl-CoA dioxygenase (PhyH)